MVVRQRQRRRLRLLPQRTRGLATLMPDEKVCKVCGGNESWHQSAFCNHGYVPMTNQPDGGEQPRILSNEEAAAKGFPYNVFSELTEADMEQLDSMLKPGGGEQQWHKRGVHSLLGSEPRAWLQIGDESENESEIVGPEWLIDRIIADHEAALRAEQLEARLKEEAQRGLKNGQRAMQAEALLKVQTGTAKRLAEKLEQAEVALKVAVKALETLLVGTTEGRVHTLGCGCKDPQCVKRAAALDDPAIASLKEKS